MTRAPPIRIGAVHHNMRRVAIARDTFMPSRARSGLTSSTMAGCQRLGQADIACKAQLCQGRSPIFFAAQPTLSGDGFAVVRNSPKLRS